MKILLLGDFSSFHLNLKKALEKHFEVTVILASNRDGWKDVDCDIFIGQSSHSFISKCIRIIKSFYFVYFVFKNFDIVQLISPQVFPSKINKFLIKKVIENNKKTFLIGAGCNDPKTADFFQNHYKHKEFYKNICYPKDTLDCQSNSFRSYFNWLLDNINGYIPIMYEYAEGFRLKPYSKLLATIPIPTNTQKKPNLNQNDKIIFFHGLTRERVKGSPLVKEAFDELRIKYKDVADFIVEGYMPYHDYISLFETVDVVVDQIYSVSLGVNGVLGLSKGKVVVGGGEIEFLKEFSLNESPIVSIEPNVEDIKRKLIGLIERKDELLKIKKASYDLAVSLHDEGVVASKYMSTWNEI